MVIVIMIVIVCIYLNADLKLNFDIMTFSERIQLIYKNVGLMQFFMATNVTGK